MALNKLFFDVDYYLDNNPDLKASLSGLPAERRNVKAINHFQSIGKNEKRKYRYTTVRPSSIPSKSELFKAIVNNHHKITRANSRDRKKGVNINSIEIDIDFEKEHRIIKKEIEKFKKKYEKYTSGERDV